MQYFDVVISHKWWHWLL